jgi:hypothetical protein
MTNSEINRENAQHSTGPKTEAGKLRSSMNALRHGLTAEKTVMPSEDMDVYDRHLQSFVDEYDPQGATETQLVQTLADASWRLDRIVAIEIGVMKQNLTDEATMCKSLSNLSLHSNRLTRQFERAVAQLRDLQKLRRDQEKCAMEELLATFIWHKNRGETYDHAKDGFVFSQPQIDAALRARQRRMRTGHQETATRQ